MGRNANIQTKLKNYKAKKYNINFKKLNIFGQLGKGSFGTVFASRFDKNVELFAIKQIPKKTAQRKPDIFLKIVHLINFRLKYYEVCFSRKTHS